VFTARYGLGLDIKQFAIRLYKVNALWNVKLCSLVNIQQHTGRIGCLHPQDDNVSHLSSRLHDVTSEYLRSHHRGTSNYKNIICPNRSIKAKASFLNCFSNTRHVTKKK
jgi:hypothetical protein